jgi:hypothetical protein
MTDAERDCNIDSRDFIRRPRRIRMRLWLPLYHEANNLDWGIYQIFSGEQWKSNPGCILPDHWFVNCLKD